MPPPAEGFAARLLLGPALRAQPDRRLVTLVREGYETAFEEIVRRYGRALTSYAAAIVGGHAEDVTQDAFSKALLALRRDGAEIELRPWLFRILRNTAFNDLRDRPPSAEALAEAISGGRDPEEELERREELADLMQRLQSLPKAQRAAIVMRELEGLGHDEIAAALGLSGGAARQAIYRARQALRDGLGMLLPLPALKALLAGTAAAQVEAAAGAAGVGGAAGAGIALKTATATVLVAGAVGADVAIDHGDRDGPKPGDRAAQVVADDAFGTPISAPDESSGGGHRPEGLSGDRGGQGGGEGDGRGPGPRDGSGERHGGDAESPGADGGNRGPGGGGDHQELGDDRGGSSGPPGENDGVEGHQSGRSPEGSSGPGGGTSGGDGGGGDRSGPGDGSAPPPSEGEPAPEEGSASNSGPGSIDGGGGSGDSGDGSSFGDSGDSHGGTGFSLQTEP
jgi:RNA polymerase sigma factor (sigma-70 family)